MVGNFSYAKHLNLWVLLLRSQDPVDCELRESKHARKNFQLKEEELCIIYWSFVLQIMSIANRKLNQSTKIKVDIQYVKCK